MIVAGAEPRTAALQVELELMMPQARIALTAVGAGGNARAGVIDHRGEFVHPQARLRVRLDGETSVARRGRIPLLHGIFDQDLHPAAVADQELALVVAMDAVVHTIFP